jgi:prepilin-type N-terminal cleavage/methylation domain-containing protein
MIRERLRALHSERGMTLLETLISTALLGIVVTIFLNVLVTVQSGLGRQTDRSQDNDQARLAVENLDREIRSGNLLYDPALEDDTAPAGSDIAEGMSLRIYTQSNANTRDPGNRCVQWRITSGDQLQRRDWSINWQTDGIVSGWRVVAENVVNRSLSPPVPAFALDADPEKGGRIVVITVVTNTNAESGLPVRITQSVTGRNTQYGYPIQICADIPAY